MYRLHRVGTHMRTEQVVYSSHYAQKTENFQFAVNGM